MKIKYNNKNYCVSQCFKREMSAKLDSILTIVLMIAFAIAVIGAVALTIIIFGLIGQAVYVAIFGNLIGFPIALGEAGLLVAFGSLLLVMLSYTAYTTVIRVYSFVIALFNKTKHLTKAAMGYEKLECTIFEECD